MTVHAVDLPDGGRITATRFDQHCIHYEHAGLHRLRPGEGYSSHVSSVSELAEYPTELRKNYATAGVVEYLSKLPRKSKD